ncbi:acid protease [Gyrodon lividus]|nr:acid protease [Gyrodon lividus]
MRFTLATVIAALPFFVAALAPQPARQGEIAIPLSDFKRSSLVNADKRVIFFEALNSHVASTRAFIPICYLRILLWRLASGGQPLIGGPNIWFDTITAGTPALLYAGTHVSFGVLTVTTAAMATPSTIPIVFAGGSFIIQYGNGDTALGEQWMSRLSDSLYGLRIEQSLADRLIGMTFQSISEYNESFVFQTLVTRGQSDELVFTFGFATPRPELYIGDFTYAQVIQQGFWKVNIDKVVGNGQIVLTNVAGIIDIGSDLIHALLPDVATLYGAISGTLSLAMRSLASASLSVARLSFPIPTWRLKMGLNPDGPSPFIGAIVAGDVPSWVIGTIFLGSVYTAFDLSDVILATFGFHIFDSGAEIRKANQTEIILSLLGRLIVPKHPTPFAHPDDPPHFPSAQHQGSLSDKSGPYGMPLTR